MNRHILFHGTTTCTFAAAAGIMLVLAISHSASAQPATAGTAREGRSAARQAALTPEDYIEIQQLYSAYALALDTGNGEAQAETFATDGKYLSDLTKHQPENAAAMAKRTTADGVTGARHFMTNIVIIPTPEGAKGSCYAIVLSGQRNADGGMSGTPAFYNDTLVKTAQGWRFKTREVWLPGEPNSPYKARNN